MRYLLGAKPGDHAHLFDQVIAAGDEDRIETVTRVDLRFNAIQSETQYVNDLALNASNQSVRVNFLQHFEYDPDTRRREQAIQLGHGRRTGAITAVEVCRRRSQSLADRERNV